MLFKGHIHFFHLTAAGRHWQKSVGSVSFWLWQNHNDFLWSLRNYFIYKRINSRPFRGPQNIYTLKKYHKRWSNQCPVSLKRPLTVKKPIDCIFWPYFHFLFAGKPPKQSSSELNACTTKNLQKWYFLQAFHCIPSHRGGRNGVVDDALSSRESKQLTIFLAPTTHRHYSWWYCAAHNLSTNKTVKTGNPYH